MVKKETENFSILSEINLDYFDYIVDYILENENNILSFFKLQKLPQKFNILIMSYDSFKDEQIKRFGKVIDYIRGITDGKNNSIMILSIEDQIKYTTHKDSTLDDTLKMILHEVVHLCNFAVNKDCDQTTWFREGLAINLASQKYQLVELNDCNFDLLKKDFYNYGKNNYSYAYTIVYYILNNYDAVEVNKLITDSDYLRKNSNRLFEEAKEYFINEKLSKR